MLLTTLIAILIIFGLLVGWIAVQHLTRAFAVRHPEFGPAREDGGGCGGLFCLCKGDPACPRRKMARAIEDPKTPVAPIIPLENAHSEKQE
jgi:hypothetical protein